MTTTSLTETLLQQLQGPALQQVAQSLGIDAQQAQDAVGAALPLLMGALGRNAQQPQGAEALLGALQRDHAGGGGFDLGGLLGSVLGGGSGNAQTDGAGILGHVFGTKAPQAASQLGQATGLGGDKASQLLQILAPIVLAFLAKRFLGNGQADASQLGQTLGQEQQHVAQSGVSGLLGSVLDQDGDGQLGVGDLLKIGGGLFGKS